MTRVDGGVVGKAEEAFLDAFAEHLVAAAFKVGAAYAAAEEGITGEDPSLDFGIEADATIRMTRGADDLKGTLTYFNYLAVFQVAVRHFEVTVGRKSKPGGLLLGAGVVIFHIRMCRHGDAVALFDGGIADDMVDVAVGADSH